MNFKICLEPHQVFCQQKLTQESSPEFNEAAIQLPSHCPSDRAPAKLSPMIPTNLVDSTLVPSSFLLLVASLLLLVRDLLLEAMHLFLVASCYYDSPMCMLILLQQPLSLGSARAILLATR